MFDFLLFLVLGFLCGVKFQRLNSGWNHAKPTSPAPSSYPESYGFNAAYISSKGHECLLTMRPNPPPPPPR